MRALLLAALLAPPVAAKQHPEGAPPSLTPAQLARANAGHGLEIPLSDQTLACLILSDQDCRASADAARSILRDSRHVPPAPPMFSVGNNMNQLLEAYPTGSVMEVKTMLGRQREDWIQNTCVIRVSMALNHSNIPQLRLDRRMLGPAQKLNFLTNANDPQRAHAYMYRVDEFANYLLKKYGKPQVYAARGDDMRAAVAGKPGVILFVVSGWNDATGHFDLWDGQRTKGGEYFEKASHVFLWQ